MNKPPKKLDDVSPSDAPDVPVQDDEEDHGQGLIEDFAVEALQEWPFEALILAYVMREGVFPPDEPAERFLVMRPNSKAFADLLHSGLAVLSLTICFVGARDSQGRFMTDLVKEILGWTFPTDMDSPLVILRCASGHMYAVHGRGINWLNPFPLRWAL